LSRGGARPADGTAHMRHLDAFEYPPDVKVVDGEVVVSGDLVCAAYTPDAAEQLIRQLAAAVQVAREQARRFDEQTAQQPHLRLVRDSVAWRCSIRRRDAAVNCDQR